ncbi:MAG: YfjI family protein [Rudaea sp.]
MNAVIREDHKEAARRLAAGAIRDGYKPEALHEYRAADGTPIYWRIRLKHPNGNKWIRPMRFNGTGYESGEPEFPNGKPLYGLDRLAADPQAHVWIVEGEACADALAKLGLTAITSGSKSSAGTADWSSMRGRAVAIWPDNDEPGLEYADAVAAKLAPLGCNLRIVDIATLGLPEHGDCVDWIAQHPDATADDVRKLPTKVAESQESQGAGNAAPEPLRRPTPPPEPYPVAELGPIIAPACESLRRVIQAPDAVCGASLLAAASLAVQGFADVHNDGRVHPLSLWMLTVAESGERKSAVDSEAMQPAREYEKVLAEGFGQAQEAHAAEMAEWEGRREHAKAQARKAGGAGLADALKKLGPPPPEPLIPRVTVADFTAEGVAKLLVAGLPSLGAFTDEAAVVFGGHAMTKETVTRTAGAFSKLWDRGELDRVRAGDGAVKLYGKRLALHLMAQPIIAERALSDDVLLGQGFLARCLLAWPESTAGHRPYVAESLRNDAAMIQYRGRLADLFRRSLPMAQGQRNELAPRALTLAPDAFTAWRRVHDAIEAQIAAGGRYSATFARACASKAPEQCLRIAGVLTLLESPDAQRIEAVTIERAAELALWHLNEAARLAGTAELSPEVRDAEELLNWCHKKAREYVCSTDALNGGPNRIRERSRFMQAMDELESAGWAHQVEGGKVLGGKHRRNVWRIVAKVD